LPQGKSLSVFQANNRSVRGRKAQLLEADNLETKKRSPKPWRDKLNVISSL